MKQVQYGSQLVSLLITKTNKTTNNEVVADNDDDDDTIILSSLIAAQLSHSDGIRGFMVSFLTRESENDDEEKDSEEIIPSPLLEALSQVNNSEDLASLACKFKVLKKAADLCRRPRNVRIGSFC